MRSFLPPEFYGRDTGEVARALLGKELVRTVSGRIIRCRIVETEAYFGSGDPASHAARGLTPGNAVMFGQPGRAYVYFNYGMHYLFNVVTEAEGRAGAVLIRAVEPLEGVEIMTINRPVSDILQLTSGPAKLTKALAINKTHNGQRLDSARLGVIDRPDNGLRVIAAPRVGISSGQEYNYRFYVDGNIFVSRKKGQNET